MVHETGLGKLKKGHGYVRSFKKRYKLDKLQNGIFMGCIVMGLIFFTVFKPYVETLLMLNRCPEMRTSTEKVSEAMESDPDSSVEDLNPIIRNISNELPDTIIEYELPDTIIEYSEPIMENVSSDPIMQNVSSSKSDSSDQKSLRQPSKHKFRKSRSDLTDVDWREPVIRNFSNKRTDVFEMIGDIRLNGSSGTILIATSNEQNITVKPYARKEDGIAMGTIRAWEIINRTTDSMPYCNQTFSVPAVVFSIRGYGGNAFHAFSDLLIPLYLTCRQFNGEVVFLTTDMESWWLEKYKTFLDTVSKYDIIDIDSQNEVLCFPRAFVGLKANKDFSIDPLQPPYYFMLDFTQFLRKVYSLKRDYVDDLDDVRKPRMLLISRQTSRRILNEGEASDVARAVGFDVVVDEIGYHVPSMAKLVNSIDVMVGIHGAGLANMVFLPKDAVVIQILPIGTDLFSSYYRIPAIDMNMKYIEYNVSREESTLAEKYPADSIIFTNPLEMVYRGFIGFRTIYLENQDVTLNLTKFRDILLKAKGLLQL
uniref:GT61_2 n=1 Tax=Plantago ovata TaxID=185002 RepID=S5SD01_PLAOV|nr:GT61_2 [Plantago ovata]